MAVDATSNRPIIHFSMTNDPLKLAIWSRVAFISPMSVFTSSESPFPTIASNLAIRSSMVTGGQLSTPQ